MDYKNTYMGMCFLLKILYLDLFLLAVIGIFTPFLQFFFVCTPYLDGRNFFSILSSTSIAVFGVVWGLFRALELLRGLSHKEMIKEIFCRSFRFIGLRKLRLEDPLYLLVGGAFNAYIIFVLRGFRLNISLQNLLITESLLMISLFPLFEEIIFRGIYLSTIEEIYGRNYRAAIIGLVFSSFTFGRIHTDPLPTLSTKILFGFVFGVIYLFKWRRNLTAALFTHMGANIVGVLAAQ